MKRENFNKIVENTINEITDTLIHKGIEYAPFDDRLSSFKKSAILMDTLPQYALVGQLSKHIVSIFEMAEMTPKSFTNEKWDEKINDAICYLILLKGIIREDTKIKEEKPDERNLH